MKETTLTFARTPAGLNIHDVSNKPIGTILIPGDTEPTVRIGDEKRSLFFSDIQAIAGQMYASRVDALDPAISPKPTSALNTNKVFDGLRDGMKES